MALPGVGEALKREIAGFVLADQPWLWGFEERVCFESDWASWVRGAYADKRILGFAGFLPICVAPWVIRRPLHHGYSNMRRQVGPHAMWRAAEVKHGDLRHACHAAALAAVGGALGFCCGAKVSTMSSCPPQHGQGSARTRGCSPPSPLESSPSCASFVGLALSNALILAILAALFPFPKNP